MVKTYAELTQQIVQLQAQAEVRRLAEAKGVIRTINEAIASYGLTAADLKFAESAALLSAVAKPQPAGTPKSAARVVLKSGGQGYSDGAGNVWTGRGPCPKWLREALAAGVSIARFEVTSHSKSTPKSPTSATAKAHASAPAPVKSKLPVKYRDAETGAAWTGRGMKPAWLREALESGKELAEFEVSKPNGANGAAAPASTSLPVKVTAKLIPAALPARRPGIALTSVKKPADAKKSAIASKAAPKKAVVTAAKTERAPARAASALHAASDEAHVPVDSARALNDSDAAAAPMTPAAPTGLVSASPQKVPSQRN